MSHTFHLRIPSNNNNRTATRKPKPRRRNSWPSLPTFDKTLNILFPTPALNKCVVWICGSEAKYMFLRQKDLRAWASRPATIANTDQSAVSASGVTAGAKQVTPSSAQKLWQEPNFRETYWKRREEEESRLATASKGKTPTLGHDHSRSRTISGSTLVSFPSPQEVDLPKKRDKLAVTDSPPASKVSPIKNSPPISDRPLDTNTTLVRPHRKSPNPTDAFKFKPTPLRPGQKPFVPVPVFSLQWDLPPTVIETNNPCDPRLQAYLRKHKINAVLHPDTKTISSHARMSSREQEAMDHFVRRPDCRIDAQYLDPVLAREKRQRMAEQAMISNIPQPTQQKISSQRKVVNRRGSGGKRSIDGAAQQEEMARQANAAYEAQQKAAGKKAAPVMERSSTRRLPSIPTVPTKPVALPAVTEECDEWDPSWVVEQAKA